VSAYIGKGENEDLEAKLKEALEKEDYITAAQIKAKIDEREKGTNT